jgi:Tfp pilus assembly protein PilW
MRIFKGKSRHAFTLVEMMTSVACGSIILAAVITAAVALQKSITAIENYSNTEGSQLRVLDYIAMDCRRATAVSVTNNQLQLTLPVYYNSGSSYAAYTPSLSNCSAGGCTLTYGTGSVTVLYQQSGTNFNRVVTVNDASGNALAGYPQTTTIAQSVSSFTVTPSNSSASVTCSVMFFPNFVRMTGTGTWWNGTAAPANGTGLNGDWYVVTPASDGSNASTVGDVYYKSGGIFAKIQNVKATTLYMNTFLRTAAARSTNNA